MEVCVLGRCRREDSPEDQNSREVLDQEIQPTNAIAEGENLEMSDEDLSKGPNHGTEELNHKRGEVDEYDSEEERNNGFEDGGEGKCVSAPKFRSAHCL